MGAFGRLLIKSWGGNLNKYEGNYNKQKTIMENNTQEFISLFNYLKKPAGPLGQEVYAAAKKAGETVNNEEVITPKFTGKVLTYRREFLDKYFKKDGDDLPF